MSWNKRHSRANTGQGQSTRLGGRPEQPGPEAPPSGSASLTQQPRGGSQHNPWSIYIHHVPQHSPAEKAEVLAAVETLYHDKLRPYGRILRKRLTERAQSMGRGTVDIDVRLLRDLCATSPWLYVQEEEGGEWSALLRSRPPSFIDVYSPEDVYPADLWSAAEEYFVSMNEVDMVLPGGRYACAQVLAGRQLPFLSGYSLGEICHIVQLAISQKKLLGYLNGNTVPYSHSQSMVKERCAENQRPCTSITRKANVVATWDMLHACLHELLRSLGPGSSSIPLSNVKRLFRLRFQVELSETALGYAKLSELFQDERLQDICSMRLQGQGYVIVPIATGDNDAPLTGSPPSKSRGRGGGGSTGGGSTGSGSAGDGGPQAPHPSNSSLQNRARWIKPLSPEDLATPQLATPMGGTHSSGSSANGNGGAPHDVFPPTPSPMSMHHQYSLPTLLGCGGKGRREGRKHDSASQPDPSGGNEETHVSSKCGLTAASSSRGKASAGSSGASASAATPAPPRSGPPRRGRAPRGGGR